MGGAPSPTDRGAIFLQAITLVLASIIMIGRPVFADELIRMRPDVMYAVHGGVDLYLDAYLPRGRAKHPAVILIHGGRWSYGDKHDLAPLAFGPVERGFAAFSINYRLLPDWPYPAPVADAKAAVAWVRANAADLRVDPARIAALGGSAGGYLAAALATFGKGPLTGGTRVAAAASWSGPMDLETLLPVADANVGATIAAFLGCTPGQVCASRARAASPIEAVDAGDSPLLLANAVSEAIPIEQARSMALACQRVALPHVLLTPGGRGHGMANEGELLQPTVRFLERWLGKQHTPTPVAIGRADPVSTDALPGAIREDTNTRGSGDEATHSSFSPPETILLLSLIVMLVAATSIQVSIVKIESSQTIRRTRKGPRPSVPENGAPTMGRTE